MVRYQRQATLKTQVSNFQFFQEPLSLFQIFGISIQYLKSIFKRSKRIFNGKGSEAFTLYISGCFVRVFSQI